MRLRGPLAQDSTARILHILLLGFAAWIILSSPILLTTTPRKYAASILYLLASFMVLAALVLINRGFLRGASLVYVCGTWLIWTVVMVLNGGIHSLAATFYVAIPISAAWLLGYQAALVSAAVSLAIWLILAILDVYGFRMPLYFPGKPFNIWLDLVLVMIIAAVPVAQVLQVLKQALARSQEAETALRQHQEHLEELIHQRTAELVEARNQAQAANRAKTAFLANMSHELRAPLNTILGFSALVRADTGISDQHRKDLEIVGSSGEHLLRLIDEVLDMAKIEMGAVVPNISSVDLRALVKGTVNMLRERAHVKNLELGLDISSAVPRFVRTDGGKLRQVLTNLVGNAIKYTDQGSVMVQVDAKPEADSQRLVLIFDVEDTGIGIAPEDQVRIFDPFVQGGTARFKKGTGLGLSISRHFVQLLGGAIQVQSALGRGSRFYVEVPAQAAEAAGVMAETARMAQVVGLQPGQTDYRILVAEGLTENWLLLERLLQTVGFEVRRAEDGWQAIEIFEAWRPHFIWMALHLPDISGLEAARRIREMQGGREVKIVAVTASAFASQRDEVLAAGLDDFLRKPYRPREIFDCMARHLDLQYVFGAPHPAAMEELPAPLRPQDFEALPEELRKELENAILSLDGERIARVVSQVSQQDSALGGALARLASQLAYTPIVRALESCKAR